MGARRVARPPLGSSRALCRARQSRPSPTTAPSPLSPLRFRLRPAGKYTLGFKQALKSLRSGKAKLILVSSNCPSLRKSEIDYYAMLAKISVQRFAGSNVELGTACGKLFRSSVMSIIDGGDSDILRSLPGQ